LSVVELENQPPKPMGLTSTRAVMSKEKAFGRGIWNPARRPEAEEKEGGRVRTTLRNGPERHSVCHYSTTRSSAFLSLAASAGPINGARGVEPPLLDEAVMSPRRNPVVSLESQVPRLEGEIVEIPLLLPQWQASALESAAYQRGVTVAALLRLLLGGFLATQPVSAPVATPCTPARAV
jgi:hypothetical protein